MSLQRRSSISSVYLVPADDDDGAEEYFRRIKPLPRTRKHKAHTPLMINPSSTLLTEHDRASVHVWIREDLKYAEKIKFDVFVEGILGLTPQVIAEWVSIIRAQEWYKDQELSRDLGMFCNTASESGRYDPLARIINRIMYMAHGRLPGVPDTYPIDDICVRKNDPCFIQAIAAHGDLGALRKPDLLTIRARHAVSLTSKSQNPSSPDNATAVHDDPASDVDDVPPAFDLLACGEFAATDGIDPAGTAAAAVRRRPRTRASTAKIRGFVKKTPVVEERNSDPEEKASQSSSNDKISSKGVRWVDVIMNWELKGSRSLRSSLQAFEVDRSSKHQEIVDATPGTDGEKAPTTPAVRSRPLRGKRLHVRGDVSADSMSNVPVYAGTKRPPEDDDLLVHIRRPDPPKCRDDLTSEEKESASVKNAAIQAGSYALETLACTFGTRLFCINVIMRNDLIYLWYYDACGFVYTESISLIEDFEKAAAVFVGLACCTPEQLGALPPTVFKPPGDASGPEHWPPENLDGYSLAVHRPKGRSKVQLSLQDPVFTQYVLVGRRTFVYTVKSKPASFKDDLIVKISYQVGTRKEEHVLVERAAKAGVGHLPKIHATGDLWKMSDGVRQIFCEQGGIEFEDRTLRAIVYSRYLPLETLFPHSPESIPIMAYQIMDCLHDLRYKANILHRDVSLQNVMYYWRDGLLSFVLIDFDMATIVSDDPDEPYVPSSKHRTGTLAFMATDLILDAYHCSVNDGHVPIAHMLCHDLESLFWLCLWCALVMLPVEDKTRKAHHIATVRTWETKDLWIIHRGKVCLFALPFSKAGIVLPERLLKWFRAWRDVFCDLTIATKTHVEKVEDALADGLEPPTFDEETGNGLITRDNLKRVLTAVIPDNHVMVSAKDVVEGPKPDGRRTNSKKATAVKKATRKAGATKKAGATSKKASPSKGKTAAAVKKANTAAKKASKKTAVVSKKVKVQRDEDSVNEYRKRLRPRKPPI